MRQTRGPAETGWEPSEQPKQQQKLFRRTPLHPTFRGQPKGAAVSATVLPGGDAFQGYWVRPRAGGPRLRT